MAAVLTLSSAVLPCWSCRRNFSTSIVSSSLRSAPSFSRVCSSLRAIRMRPVAVRAAVEEPAAPAVAELEGGEGEHKENETVSVPVSPSDMLTMFFKAEGTMDESAIPAVSKAVEGMEGVADLKVQILEGIASVELTKETTVQATGVASNIVEVIQGSGFKLQTLNLSFKDEEDAA